MVRRSGKFFDARYVDIAGRQLGWEEIIRITAPNAGENT